MNERRMSTQLIRYLDGELSPVEREKLDQMLAENPELQARLDSLRDSDRAWRESLAYPGKKYSFATLRARLTQVRPLDEIRLFLPRVRMESPAPRIAMAAVFFMAMGASWVTGKLSRPQENDLADRLADRNARLDDMISLTADPTADWPEDTRA